MRRLIFRSAASAELRRIAKFTKANWGADLARKYGARLREQIKSLRELPMRYAEGEERSGIRQMRFGKHLIFYRVSDDDIEIVQILHVARDIDNRLE